MNKEKRKCLSILCSLAAALFFGSAALKVEAGTLYESRYVTFSPDREAWTIREALPAGFDAHGSVQRALSAGVYYPLSSGFMTGEESRLEKLSVGQHYYRYARREEVPVGEWRVAHVASQCVHGMPEYPKTFHGVSFGTTLCGGRYYSGWVPYCADCGELVTDGYLVYASADAVRTITSIDTTLKIYYTCPTCSHLEQGVDYKHICRKPSYNRYQVQYEANIPNSAVNNYVMDFSFHMYDNATEYEGSPVVPQTTLNRNEYQRPGYVFVSWNTRPDGSGTSYGDGAEIRNLTTENYDKDAGIGTVPLYAQWERSRSTLRIDPNGGAYDGKKSPTVIGDGYGSIYEIDQNRLSPPNGFRVSFDTRGGNSLSPMDTDCAFVSWEKGSPFLGRMRGLKYAFTAPDGNVDTVTANWVQGSITLPTPGKPGFSFGGWFEDPEGKKPVGMGGDPYTPSGDTTLYAKWVDMVLYSTTDLTVDNGKGGVDLTWVQPDTLDKTYKIYQSRDNDTFYQISAATRDATEAAELDISYTAEGVKSYTVKSSGYYTIEADGASGRDFGSYKGGKGGKVTATFYLTKGDTLSITVGKQGGGGSGSSEGGAGGGMSVVKSAGKGILLIAGGGGGALTCADGGDGGAVSLNISQNGSAGKSGTAGGGSGAAGGAAGSWVPSHTHSEAQGCYHHHAGSAVSGGGCYTSPAQVVCGTYQSNGVTYAGWWRYDDDPTKGCQQCNRPREGHPRDHPTYHYKCSGCGVGTTGQGNDGKTHYKPGWSLGCGKTDGQLMCSKSTAPGNITPAEGGSSYISAECLNIVSAIRGGAQKGNGSVYITAKSVGYSDACKLDDVSANDKAAPEKISVYSKEGVGSDKVLVSWEKPEDSGTVYYHRVESYDSATGKYIITSNTTKNLVTTGVAGYYYMVDTSPYTTVNTYNAQNKGKLLSQSKNDNTCSIQVLVGEETRYLHVVAVDAAGNLDPEKTLHILLDYDDSSIDWTVATKQIQVGGILGKKDYGSVYASPTENKTWYVKADGTTPFLLSYVSDMEGKARKNYMIDYQIFDTRIGERNQQFITRLPYSPISNTASTLDASRFVRKISGTSILKDAMYIGAVRSVGNTEVSFHQAFSVSDSYNGQHITVTPIAGITTGTDDEIKYSDQTDDALHCVTLIPDSEGPVIRGTEALESLTVIKQWETAIDVTLTASDDLSGVAIFYVEIENLDSVYRVKYTPDEDGRIRLHFSSQEPVLNGDFVIRVYATDHVGNETIQEYSATEFALRVEISRILEPHTPVFQGGESGILTIQTYGYAEKVEVEFPAEMTALNPDLNKTYYYGGEEQYRQDEEMQFMIPLHTPPKDNYVITVRAYKGDRKLEQYPTLGTISVSGNVLDELRTRLR